MIKIISKIKYVLPEDEQKLRPKHAGAIINKYEGRLISNAHSEISRKRDHTFKQTKVGSKVQYFS